MRADHVDSSIPSDQLIGRRSARRVIGWGAGDLSTIYQSDLAKIGVGHTLHEGFTFADAWIQG
jgi:hypothetical protein